MDIHGNQQNPDLIPHNLLENLSLVINTYLIYTFIIAWFRSFKAFRLYIAKLVLKMYDVFH